jgi:antitoxin (DNA-binding transcriptional repressor) of toxin-antitoxin stability system
LAILRALRLVALLPPLAACPGPEQPDLDQLARMRTESTAARAGESIGCTSRDRVCAQLVQLRGEACAARANDMLGMSAAERAKMRSCALGDARRLPGLLPADAQAAEQEAAASTIFDAWRGALDVDDPAADPASLNAAVDDLRAIPGGATYAATLNAAGLIHAAVHGASADGACGMLAQALAMLPASPPSALASRVTRERATATVARSKMGCH